MELYLTHAANTQNHYNIQQDHRDYLSGVLRGKVNSNQERRLRRFSLSISPVQGW